MPRKARITIPGAIHHVMSRGIEGCCIFRDDNDRGLFKGLIESIYSNRTICFTHGALWIITII